MEENSKLDLVTKLIEKIEVEENLIEENQKKENDSVYINECFGRLTAYANVIDMLDEVEA